MYICVIILEILVIYFYISAEITPNAILWHVNFKNFLQGVPQNPQEEEHASHAPSALCILLCLSTFHITTKLMAWALLNCLLQP